MILKYNDFLTEKLGISSDVLYLIRFLLPKLNGKDTIIDNIPDDLSFKINKMFIKFTNKNSGFDISRSKLTENGFNLYIILNNKYDIKSTLYHELTHVIKYQSLVKKNIKLLSKNYKYENKNFDNLLYLLYCSDESEINAKVAEIYSKIEDEINGMSNFISKKEIFSSYIKHNLNDSDNPKILINYDIFEDLKNVSNYDKIKFFKYISDINKIKKNYNNKFIQFIMCVINDKTNLDEMDLDIIMIRTQHYINSQGEKLLKKITKLYDLYEKDSLTYYSNIY